jgi:hypothetical protein
MPRPSVWTRLVALFLLWSGLRSAWFLMLTDANPGFRLAQSLGAGPAIQFGEILYENPAAARKAYVESRRARGLGAVLSLTPLLILWWRREEFPDS